MITKPIEVPENLKKLALKLKNKCEIYLYGKGVRNAILGIQEKPDFHLCSMLTPDELMNALKYSEFLVKEKSKKNGIVYICIDNECYEHQTFRKKSQEKNTEYEFVTDLREDAKDKDFTIDTIYYSITKNRYVDIYSGIFDLEKKLVKCIETPEYVFDKDGEKILKMVRLACELNFKIEKNTYSVATKMAYRLKDVAGSKKFLELKKILNSSSAYKISDKKAHIRGIGLLNQLRVWHGLYTPISKLKTVLAKKSNRDRFIALLIDIINAVNPDCVEYYLQDVLGSKGFNLTEKQKEDAIYIVGGYFEALNKKDNKHYFFKYFDYFSEIREYLELTSKALYSKYNFFYRYLISNHIVINIRDLKITADDIKKARPKLPEKEYPAILKELLEKVFDGEIENEKSDLLRAVKLYEYYGL